MDLDDDLFADWTLPSRPPEELWVRVLRRFRRHGADRTRVAGRWHGAPRTVGAR